MKDLDDYFGSGGEYYGEAFLGFSPDLTNAHSDSLRTLMQVSGQYKFQTDDHTITPLVLDPRYSEFVSGKTESAYGLYGVHPGLFELPIQGPLHATFLHERTHTQVGSDVRRSFLEHHATVDTFFRQVVIPDWLAGHVALSHDSRYIVEKGWRSLYDGWLGPMDIKIDKAIETVDHYFQLFRKGLIRTMRMSGADELSTPSYSLAVRNLQLLEKPEISYEEFYRSNPNECTRQILTGFALIKYLEESYRSAYSRERKRDIWYLEEGFATFIGSSLAGISVVELQKFCRQDDEKNQLALKIQRTEISPIEALSRVTTYESLVDFIEEIGL